MGRILKSDSAADADRIGLNFATDIELSLIKKIEQAIGKAIAVVDLPEDLIIEKDKPKKIKKSANQITESNSETGAAFHPKKKSNAKAYNYSSKEKAKMKFKNR